MKDVIAMQSFSRGLNQSTMNVTNMHTFLVCNMNDLDLRIYHV